MPTKRKDFTQIASDVARKAAEDGPAMPFNEALKRVWSAPPAPRTKARPVGARGTKKT